MALNKAPYPPIVESWTKTVVIGDTIRVYFSLSAYSNISDIRTDIILVDVVNSQNNESVIDYAANQGRAQLITNLQIDNENKYYIEINTRLVNVEVGGTYKVQLRLCSSLISASRSDIQANPLDDAWREYISDYSTITLIKVISRPILELKQFLDVGTKADYIISTASFSVIGKLIFGEDSSDESLSCYKIELYENLNTTASDNDTLILNTGYIYPDTKELNTIFYVVKRDLKNHGNYFMKFTYMTSSDYQETKSYNFTVEYSTTITTLPPYITTELDEEDGSIDVTIEGEAGSNYKGFFILRRTSSLNNFTEWDDLKYFQNKENTPIAERTVKDYLIQTGVIYRYQVIPMDAAGFRGLWADPLEVPEDLIWDSEEQMWKKNNGDYLNEIFSDFEDIHLEGNAIDRYKMQHNATVSSFQYTVVESKTDTLGGKYPFIRRNGDTYYRQFSLSGLITHFNENDYPDEYMADNLIHNASNSDGSPLMEDYFNRRIRERVVDNNENLKNKYDKYYYSDKTLNGYTDYLLEREYRDDVTEFFYENKVRLFRSPTEGNILVKLMNISLSPNEQIKRRVYSIQCTAFETDENTVENCIKYGIWNDDKSIFTDVLNAGIADVHIGQLRHDDKPNIESQEFGPYLKTDFYQEIIDDVKLHHQNVFNVEKVIWMKSTFYSTASYFGYDKDGSVTWAVLPNSPIIPELIINTGGTPNDDDNIDVEIRTYNIEYPTNDPNKLWTKFFDHAINDNIALQSGALIAVLQQLQRLAYIIVRYCWGEAFTYDNQEYSWDDINNWDSAVKSSFLNQLTTLPWRDLNGDLYSTDTNGNIVLKNKPAWAINNIIQNCPTLNTDTSVYIDRVAREIEEDALLERAEELFDALDCTGTEGYLSIVAGAIESLSVDYMPEPFNGYWYLLESKTLVPIDDESNEYAKPLIDFWLSLAITMAVYGEWGFGKSSIDNLRAKTISDLTNGKPILIDANLTNNIITNLRTTDIDLVGHGMYINNELIIVPPQGYYELTDEDTSIIQFSQQRLKDEPLKCLIDYAVLYRAYSPEMLSNIHRTVARYYKLGQIRNVSAEQDIIEQIKEKYAEDNSISNVEVLSVPYVSIEAEPYTRIFIKDSSDSNVEEHVVNNDGIITFYNEGTSIEELYFDDYPQGQHDTIEDRNEIVYDNNYALDDLIVNYICLIKEIR